MNASMSAHPYRTPSAPAARTSRGDALFAALFPVLLAAWTLSVLRIAVAFVRSEGMNGSLLVPAVLVVLLLPSLIASGVESARRFTLRSTSV
jgi:hypothetical protein